MKRTTTLTLLMGLGALMPARAAAEPPPPPEPVRERVRALWHEMRMLKLRQELELDDKSEAKMAEVLKRFDEREAEVHRRNHEQLEELRRELHGPSPDDKRLAARMDELVKGRERVHELMRERIAELRKLLTIRQQAKLALMWPRLERKLRRMIDETREERRGPGPEDF